ncbi:hypothetical protein AI2642V1_1550 [Citrobacter freundii]|nr:hypothetical protein AI2642V1_1550 [Citrobacter freundii]CAH3425052.1 hypothetical protein AI2642V1_1550 [Citrobacter freundii]
MRAFLFLPSHHWAVIKLRVPGIINDVRDHSEYSGRRTVTVIICWQRLPSPVLQINQVGLRMSPISLDPEFSVYRAYQQRAITGRK